MPPPAATAFTRARRPSAQRPRRVLIVEDDNDNRDALVLLCRSIGHVCLCAASRAEALAMLVGRPPDLIVLDLMLPDGSGVEVLRVIRTHHFPARVAIVTGADPVDIEEVS